MAERRDVIRTRALIEKAYYELLFKKNDKKITVNDVIKEANISRGTFYAHYKDLHALADDVENTIINSLKDLFSNTTIEEVINNPKEQVKKITSIILDHKDKLKLIANNTETPQTIQKIKNLFIKALCQHSLTGKNQDEVAIISACISGLVFEPCLYWILNEEDNENLLIDTISDFVSGGMSKVFTNPSHK